ncbi:MAG: hypothetical protein Q8O76_12245, partial [Chloroflexota bacterium]|nr:hypothetical protein [Chloroflexota bacterium]
MKLMRKLQQMSLRFQVAAGVGLGFLFLFGLLAYLAASNVQQASEVALSGRLMLAESTAANTDALLLHAQRQLESLAMKVGVPGSTAPVEALQNELRRGFSVMGTYSAVALVDSRGEVMASEFSDMAFTISDPANLPVVRRALQTGRTAMEVVPAGLAPSPPVVVVAVPVVHSDSQRPLLLVGELQLSRMDVPPLPLSVPGGAFSVEIIDGQGRVMASTGDPEPGAISYHLGLLTSLMAARQAGVRLHEHQRWPDHVVAYA